MNQFQIALTGEGTAETGAIDILDPDGKIAANGSTVPKGFVKLNVPVPATASGKAWSLVVKPAESGHTEDIHLGLDAGLPPYFSLAPSSLLVPEGMNP